MTWRDTVLKAFPEMFNEKEKCVECGCRPEDHNSINRILAGSAIVLHCGGCGTCWKSKKEVE